jgi:SAM-dependent methyltransferase
MSLGRVTDTDGRPIPLPGDAPFAAVDLAPLVGVAFHLPCEDPWVRESGTPAHGYLDGARQGWLEHPEWMDSLAAESPVRLLKEASRDVYLHWWRPWLNAKRVLDLGCGVGRFTTWLLDQGADVWGVDPDVESLRRCVWSSAGRAGRLEVHWSSARQLPDVHDLDAIVACVTVVDGGEMGLGHGARCAGWVDRRGSGRVRCDLETWGSVGSDHGTR